MLWGIRRVREREREREERKRRERGEKEEERDSPPAPTPIAVMPYRPTPPVEVRTGSEGVPSMEGILRDTIAAPAGLLSRKYKALALPDRGSTPAAAAGAKTTSGESFMLGVM